MIDRPSRARLAIVLAAALLLLAGMSAHADNPLPRPHVTGPTQVNNRAPLTLKFNFPAVQWSYQGFWQLWYWTQYWHCAPGKDTAPTPIALQSHPWAGQTASCQLTQNYYMGLSPGQTGDMIRVPREGGIPATGSWYVRVRLVWKTTKPNFAPQPGPWGAWHKVFVVQSFKDAAAPPQIQSPPDKHSFAHRDVAIRVAAARRHPNPSRWEFFFEWQRAQYHTPADNAFANPHPKPSDFPRVTGLASPYRPWSTGLPVQTLAEGAVPSTMQLKFADLATGRHDTSYIYRFRVRERLKVGHGAGPWSQWRSFIVTDPVTLRRAPSTLMKMKTRPFSRLQPSTGGNRQ